MAEWDDVSSAVPATPQAASWDSVSTPDKPPLPDMTGVHAMAQQNIQQPQEGEPKQEEFGAKLDRAAGMPIAGAIGNKENDVQLSPAMRGHLMDAYKNGTATDAGDFMQSAVQAIAHAASPQDVILSNGGKFTKKSPLGIPYPEEDYDSPYGVYVPPAHPEPKAIGPIEAGIQDIGAGIQHIAGSTIRGAGEILYAPMGMENFNPISELGREIEHSENLTPEQESQHPVIAEVSRQVTGLLPAFGGPLAPLIFAAQTAGQESEAARQAGASPEQVSRARGLGLLSGIGIGAALEKLPAMQPVEREAPGFRPWLAAKAAQAAHGGVSFATIGEAQSWLSAQIEHDYNPHSEYKIDPVRVASSLVAGGLFGVIQHTPLFADYHPELRGLVGDKIGKPVDAVTNNDIAQAIRMGFEGKAPKAADFLNTASVMLGPENSENGAEALRIVYRDSGVTPDNPQAYQSMIESHEAQSNPPALGGQYAMLAPSQLTLDPGRFQYKAADEKGVTGALQGVKTWEPTLANPITAWESNDGKIYVVNGHQRTDLAKRAAMEGQQNIQVPARIYKESDGYSPEYMRTLGAYQNIAEGSGTAIDAAKILRGEAIPLKGRLPELPPKSQLVQQGRGLSELGDDAFGMVVNDIVPPAYAAEVGYAITDPREQLAAMDVLAKSSPANVEQARLIVQDIKNSGFLHGEQTGLFGEEQFAQSLFGERARILDNAVKQLRQLKTAFRTAVDQETALTEAGNVLSREKNREAKAENEKLISELQANATRKGEISDALGAAARELKSGKSILVATRQFLAAARDIESGAGMESVQRGTSISRNQSSEAKTEHTAAGEQHVIAGAEKISDKELAERKMAQVKRGRVEQKEANEGLLDIGARGQQDIFTQLANEPEPELTAEHQEIENKLGIPETMNATQLKRLDDKIGGIFANKTQAGLPKATELNDEQFRALEDYAHRVQEAREQLQDSSGKKIRKLISDQSGAFIIPEEVKQFLSDLKRDVLNFTTPMETGSDRARASAKDFANSLRLSQWNGARITNLLQDRFSSEELKGMWNAMDEASVHAQKLESQGMGRAEAMAETEKAGIGHFKLPEEQKEIIKALSDWAQHSWDEAKRLGMVEGEGLPFWTPRMAAAIGKDGRWAAPTAEGQRPSIGTGLNLRTTAGSLKERKYLTAEETESAMKKAFGDEQGEGAMLVRDIRTMPLALTRLNQAIAGRSLVDEIKQMGRETGAETVADGEREGFFTLDHPAFQTYRPKLKMNDDGKWEVQKDAEGNDLFEKTPIYISKEFEGPLRAVLSQSASDVYKALMALKGKSMGLIMYSPVIHNAVEWGRALPAMPGKVITFKIYFEGNRIKNDPAQMQEAIKAGLVPIGRRYFNQDISSIIEQPNLTPGRSWTAKLLGGLTGEISPKAGEAVKAAIDKMGDIWHNTLLWDRIADLQMGLYGNIRDANIRGGMDPKAAQAMAAHIANRFAGALPMESMSNGARKLANLTMFSRSYTIGNLGVMKDMLRGMPSDVMAQLERDIGKEGAKAASSAVRRKAIGAFVLDIGLMYVGNSILQDTFDYLKRQKDLDQIAQGYVDRYHKLLKKFNESPWEMLNIPGDLQAMSSTSTNEPGKENRILFSTDPHTGTAYYMRMPTGKLGEEFEGWLTSPLEMARKKVSPLISPLIDTYRNADYFGHPIYDKDAKGISGMAENAGQVVKHFMEAQIPDESIASAYHLLTGTSHNQSLDEMKALGPLGGITFSRGYPGGPEAGILAAASRRHEAEVTAALPKIKEAVEADNEDQARGIMDKLNMTSREQYYLIKHYENPAGKVNARSLKKFERIATPEERELMEETQAKNP